MSNQNDDGGRGGPWGGDARPGADFEDKVRQGQDHLKRLMPSGGLRTIVTVALLALVGWGGQR